MQDFGFQDAGVQAFRDYNRGYIGLYRNNGKGNGNYYSILGLFWDHIGIIEKEMKTTIVYWGYIGIMEKKWKLQLGFKG